MSYRNRAQRMVYFPGFPRGVKWLILSNVAIFLIGFFAQLVELDGPLRFLALTPAFVARYFAVWQLVTYMFLHAGFGHILWNMLALWMFGADLEQLWGMKRFLKFYFFCGIGAGVCVVVLNYLLPWGNPRIPTIGSSGAIFGILMACAVLFPTRTILMMFVFPIQMKYFVMIMGTITFLSSFQANSGVSNFAHLGGLLFGYIWLKSPRGGYDLTGRVRRQYQEWKLQRAKKKFQVYLRKQNSNQDPWVH
jgi:membrane associated rhomboid family serine protease